MIRSFFAAAAFAFGLLIPAAATVPDRAMSDHSMTCAKACDDCARNCESCAAHCGRMIADGKKEHVTTHRLCADCSTTCRAASAIVARQGPMSELICTACADACKQCGEACEKFAGDPMMKECAAECRTCEKECREMLKHNKSADSK